MGPLLSGLAVGALDPPPAEREGDESRQGDKTGPDNAKPEAWVGESGILIPHAHLYDDCASENGKPEERPGNGEAQVGAFITDAQPDIEDDREPHQEEGSAGKRFDVVDLAAENVGKENEGDEATGEG